MKKISFVLALLAFVMLSIGSYGQTSFGVRAGFGLFNLDAKDSDGDKMDEFKLAPRFNIGVFAEFAISPEFVIQPSLLYATKGSKGEVENDLEGTETISINLSYIELPINFIYKAQLNNGSFLVGAGPYIGYGLKAKAKQGEETFEIPFSNTWQQIDEMREGALKPLDYGINALVGYQFGNGLSLTLNAQMGLANIYVQEPDAFKSTDKSSIKNIGFNLSVGYKF
jgi:hypothetical protein